MHRTSLFVGSWRMTFFEDEGPPTLALATFGGDGTVVTAEHPVVTPPIAPGVIFTSSGHGAWAATGPASAILTFVGLGSFGEGILFGTATARSSITLGADGQTFSGEVVWTIADPDGNMLATYPGRFQASRIVAEAPGMPMAGAFLGAAMLLKARLTAEAAVTENAGEEKTMESVRSADGTRIAYQRAGEGPPLVLVHGTADDHTRWTRLLPALGEHFTVWSHDRPGSMS